MDYASSSLYNLCLFSSLNAVCMAYFTMEQHRRMEVNNMMEMCDIHTKIKLRTIFWQQIEHFVLVKVLSIHLMYCRFVRHICVYMRRERGWKITKDGFERQQLKNAVISIDILFYVCALTQLNELDNGI